MNSVPSRPELEDILRFYHEAGLDFATGEEPVDQFVAFEAQKVAAKPAAAMPVLEKKSAAPAPRPAAVPDDAAIEAAKALAEGCASIPELLSALQGFEGCGLKFTAKSLIFADGNSEASVMFISDVPSREDDLDGKLLAAPNGLLFDRMLAAIGLVRNSAYLGCMIPWRPPGNRAPTAFEVDVCRPFIQRHIALAAPKLLVLLGDLPAKTLVPSGDSILRLRGQWRDYALSDGGTIPALSMLHPAYLMKQSAQKRLAWADLLALDLQLRIFSR
jgi:uracil-DNA glycosylase